VNDQRIASPAARRVAEQVASRLGRDPRVRLVYLFGSTTSRPGRDIDIAVVADPPIPFDQFLRIQGELAERTGAPVDLVNLEDAGVVLRHEVAASGVCLFARSPDDETNFVTRARARYWDFKPYLDEQWRLAGVRLSERQGGS
jgi:predicted nucleotidyltransferase